MVGGGGLSRVDDESRLAVVRVALRPIPELAVRTRDVIAGIGHKDAQLLGARARRELAGEEIRVIRGGHVPIAINTPYELNWQDPLAQQQLALGQHRDSSGMKLMSVEDLRKLCAGSDPLKETIDMAQSGVRAAQAVSVLIGPGFRNVRSYDSPWPGHAASPGAPLITKGCQVLVR